MINEKGFVGSFELEDISFFEKEKTINLHSFFYDYSYISDNFLSEKESEIFLSIVNDYINVPVGINGKYKDYHSEKDVVGSYRGSLYNKELAKIFFDRIKKSYPEKRNFLESTTTDHDNFNNWKLIGVNPLFRFIKYLKDGSLIPHYDAPYIKNNRERTLVTMIIYLTDNNKGFTRFLKDSQINIPVNDKNLNDWSDYAKDEEVIKKVNPKKGRLLLFDHRILHDSEKISYNEEKVIIRTDLIFEKNYAK